MELRHGPHMRFKNVGFRELSPLEGGNMSHVRHMIAVRKSQDSRDTGLHQDATPNLAPDVMGKHRFAAFMFAIRSRADAIFKFLAAVAKRKRGSAS